MTIEEIKKTFGINITNDCRGVLYVVLRSIYVEDNLYKTDSQLADELNRERTSVYYLRTKIEDRKIDPLFNFVRKLYDARDINLKIKSYTFIEERKAINKKINKLIEVREIKEYVKQKKIVKTEDRVSDKKHATLFEVAEKLRHKTTYLNNKQFCKWTYKDWDNYKEIICN